MVILGAMEHKCFTSSRQRMHENIVRASDDWCLGIQGSFVLEKTGSIMQNVGEAKEIASHLLRGNALSTHFPMLYIYIYINPRLKSQDLNFLPLGSQRHISPKNPL